MSAATLALLLQLLPAGPAAEARCGIVDLELMLEDVRAGQDEDLARWRELEFRREVRRERLGQDGALRAAEQLLFEIAPEDEGFGEVLVAVDGRAPTRAQRREHRAAGRFEKRWRRMAGPREGAEPDSGFSLRQLFGMSDYQDAGLAFVEGRPCRRLDFGPGSGDGGESLASRIADAMEGSLFVCVESGRVLRAQARTIKPVSAGAGLARLRSLELSMDQRPVAAGLVLPTLIELRSEVRLLLGVQRKRNRYRYFDFRPAA